MLRKFLDGLDDRTGYRQIRNRVFGRPLPGRPTWTGAVASCLVWLSVVQLTTGLLLMATYSPSATAAWASVHYIEQYAGGSFLRGLHYFTGHALLVVAGVYFITVILTRAYRPPRELIWITGIVLFLVLVAFAVTGNPLAGTQKGMTQIVTEANITAGIPAGGTVLRRILLGGEEAGNLALVHFYLLHVGLLPLATIVLLVIHFGQVYRHPLRIGVLGDGGCRPLPHWPFQSAVNMAVLAIVLVALGYMACRIGAPLGAPADPNLPSEPRPEWYFLFLFALREIFGRQLEYIATSIIPAVTIFLLLVWPWIDRLFSHAVSLIVRSLLVVAGAAAVIWLTLIPVVRDAGDEEFQADRAAMHKLDARAWVLADQGRIPPEGAGALLRDDPKTQGPILFKRHCASCHPYTGENGEGIPADEPSAPNLYGFGTRRWVAGWLDPEKIQSDDYFGLTHFAPKDTGKTAQGENSGQPQMTPWLRKLFKKAKTEAEKTELREELGAVARALAAEARPAGQAEADRRDEKLIAQGRKLMIDKFACGACHGFDGQWGSAVDLTGYGSRRWLVGIIADPAQERFYGKSNDRMPAYFENPADSKSNALTPREMNLLADWLKRRWYEPDTRPEYVAADLDVVDYTAVDRSAEAAGVGPDGAALFARHCASCHPHTSPSGQGIPARGKPTAPNLYAFGGQAWHEGLLDPKRVGGVHYFGNTAFAEGDMVENTVDAFDLLDEDETAELKGQLKKIARALVAEAKLPAYREADRRDAEMIEEGKELLVDELACIDCHTFYDDGETDAPNLTGYGSKQWLRAIISNPGDERFYPDGENDRMPAFAAHPENPAANLLSPAELDALVEWLRRAGHESPPAAPAK